MSTRTIPIVRYDCSQCPGYCCSYPRIEVKAKDVARLAKHFGIGVSEAERRFTRIYKSDAGNERILKHHKDTVYESICRFFDRTERRCTIYKARPGVCRAYPDGPKCGYFDFLKFERKHQGDPDFIPSA